MEQFLIIAHVICLLYLHFNTKCNAVNDITGIIKRKLGTAKASREIQSVSQAMSMGGPAGARVVGGLAGTKALSNAMAYQNVLDRVKKNRAKTISRRLPG